MVYDKVMISNDPSLSQNPLEFSLLSDQQQLVIEAFESGKNLFVTGSAGSGKSYLLNYLKRNYSHLGLAITASTGIAAVNIGGSTIHSWAGIGLANMPIGQIVENLFSSKMSRVRRRIKQAKALAIDEISMISAELLDLLDQVLRQVRENNKPMGGLQILLFGDFLQLPPINKNGDFNFCFTADGWKELDLQAFFLERNFRQLDQNFIKILGNLRIGRLDESDVKILQSRVNAEDDGVVRPAILTTHNFKVEKINELELRKIPHKEMLHEAEYFGDQTKIEFLKKNCLAPTMLRTKIGAQVMMLKNSYQKDGIINGSLGVVRDFSPKKFYPIVEFVNGKILTISPEEWLIEKYDEEKRVLVVEARVVQVPLILAWAMTIHKSQGLTLDKISCDLEDIFTHGQAYVAISRARTLSGVFIRSINFNNITSNPHAERFYQGLK